MADSRDFASYEDKDQRRGFLFGAAVLGAGAALAVPAVRKGLLTHVLKGIEYAGNHLASVRGPVSLRSTAAQLTSILERQLPRSAELSIGLHRSRGFLEGELARYSTAQRAAIHAEEIVGSAAFRTFLTSGRRAEELLEEKGIQAILQGRITAAHAADATLGLPAIRQRETNRLLSVFTQTRSLIPTELEVAAMPVFQRAQELLHGMARSELERQSRWQESVAGTALGWFGIRPTTLGEVAHTRGGKQLLGRLGNFHTEEAVLRNLPLGGMVEFGGQRYDLRGAKQLLHDSTTWFRSNFQIPLAPGAMGINPLQLMPWTKGGMTWNTGGKVAAHIPGFATDPALAAHLGGKVGVVGRDVFQVGRKFASVDFLADVRKAGATTQLDQAVQLTDLRGELRSSMWGFMRHRTEAVQSALEARAAGGPKGRVNQAKRWLGIGNDLEQSVWGRLGSIVGKYKEGSDYAPRLFDRILNGGEARARDIRRASHFLTRRGLSPKLAAEMGAAGEKLFSPELGGFVGSLTDDRSVLKFFETAAAADPKQSRYLSSRLSRMINEYRASPASVIGRIQPQHASESFLGWNFFGQPGEKRGFQLMREAILDEVEEKLRSGTETGFVRFVRDLGGLTASERDEALAYGRGKLLLHKLESGKGAQEAADWLRSTREAQEDIGRHVARTTQPHHVWSPSEPAEFGTAELFVQKRFSFIEELNRRRARGESVPRAIMETVTGGWGRQYGAFFTGNQKDVTSATLGLEYFPRRLNEYLQEVGLGLPDQDLLSGGSIMGNLLLKRILPAVAGVEGYRYLDHAGRGLFGFGPSDAYANLRARAGLLRARMTGQSLLGVRRELLPGLDKYLPGREENEEWEHQQSGYEPIRKGRFWSIGSRTEYTGDKIDYYAPAAVRTARSDWQSAENADLNTTDYWRQSLLPTPENFFTGPLNLLLNNNWWEDKHAAGPNAERPYLRTGSLFDPNTIHGPLLNATLGQILKPPTLLHPEYLPRDLGGTASREDLRRINEALKQGADQRGVGLLVGGGGIGTGGGGGSGGGLGSPGVIGQGGAELGSLAVMTPAGQLTPISVPGGASDPGWSGTGRSSIQREGHGKRLSRYEIERINRRTEAGLGGGTKLRPSAALRAALSEQPFRDEDLDLIDYQSGTLRGLHNLSDVAGLYGFFARTAASAAGLPIQQKGLVVADANRAYGFARRWYDLDLGGLGGGINELGRRFLTRPDKINEYNPIRNRMPSWLPGPEYFLDLQHGDPYAAVKQGLIRLPGEAYERTHGTRLMQTRASSLGKSVPELMQQMLFLKEPMSAYGEEATEQGNIFHRQLQAKWKRLGILIAAESRIENEKLGISGHFDAILDTRQGPLLLDIKTVNDRRYQEALRRPFEEHVSQVNYYLHETGVKRGGILYLNRDKPWQIHTHEFGFSNRQYNKDVNKVRLARKNLMDLVDKGTINRGDLYCVSPSTMIEVEGSRLVRADAIQEGDNVKTHRGNLKKVLRVRKRQINIEGGEAVYRFRVGTLTALPFTLSENHPVLTLKRPKMRRQRRVSKEEILSWRFASDLQPGDYVAYPLPGCKEQERVIDLGDYAKRFGWHKLDRHIYYGKGSQEFAEILHSFCQSAPTIFGWGERKQFLEDRGWSEVAYNRAQQQWATTASGVYWIARHLPVDEGFATLAGYYCAEGSSSGQRVSFAFHSRETGYIREIQDYICCLGIDPGRITAKSTSGLDYRFNNVPLATILPDLFGSGAHDKSLPDWWSELPRPVLIAFLRALFNGDGYAFTSGRLNRIGLASVSSTLCYQIRSLLLSFGIVGSIVALRPHRAVRTDGVTINSGPSFQLHYNGLQAQRLAILLGYQEQLDMEKTTSYAEDRGWAWFTDSDYLYLRVKEKETLDPKEVPEVIGFQVEEDETFCVAGVATHNSPIDRFEIVADVASYSENYTQLREYLVDQKAAGQLSEEENARFQAAKKRVAAQKKRVNLYPNRFRGLDLDFETVTVDKILDPNTFTVQGSDNPIRLAGVRSSQERIHDVLGAAPEGMSAAEWQFEQFGIRQGARIKVGLESDPMRRIADDVLKTRHAVVFGKGGNVNRQLIESGIGTEKETDYSDTGVAARFTGHEMRVGKFWEWFSHLDTAFHSKFLRVRTAKEELERGIVYGKSTGGWQHPFKDYVIPTVESYAAKNPLVGGVALGAFATFFWKTPQMKLKAFGAGAAVGAGLSLLRSGYEHATGNVWKPTRTRKREELEEFWDILKYVKIRGMAAQEEGLAQKEEGVDVDRMARDVFQAGEKRKKRVSWLEKEKRQLILDDKAKNLEQIKAIQQQLNKLAEPVGMLKLGPHATRALQLRELYRSTLYGYTEGSPFLGLFRAMPKYKRELISQFIEKSDDKERQEIFNLLPRAEQRALGGALGISKEQIPERPMLSEYFKEHPLPGPEWKGWSPEVDLEQLRQRAIEGERLDPFESGIYPQQIEEARRDTANVPVPTLHGSTADIQGRLNQALSGRGLKGLRVSVNVAPKDGEEDEIHVNMDLRHRREQDLRDALQMHA